MLNIIKTLDFDLRVILSFRLPLSTLQSSLKIKSITFNKMCSRELGHFFIFFNFCFNVWTLTFDIDISRFII